MQLAFRLEHFGHDGDLVGLVVVGYYDHDVVMECYHYSHVQHHDVAVGFGDASGYLEMNVYKPLMIYNVIHSITLLNDGCVSFDKYLIRGTKPNLKRIKKDLDESLMLVTALSPVIGYDKASEIAHYAMDHDLSLKEAALKLKYVTEQQFNQLVKPLTMCYPK